MGDVLADLAAEQERQHQRVRELVAERGGDHALAEYDAMMDHVRSGRYSMTMLWHSLSGPQRQLVRRLGEGDRTLVRCRHTRHFYDAYGEPYAISKVAGLGTVAKLVRLGVLRWTGPASDQAQMVELATRGRELLALLRTKN